ncbi:MAG: methyltransferase [Candidatus Margulisbacteria bacterium]|nr:methyltransferase [Candidatus Margulisiibacteriota bacterium]
MKIQLLIVFLFAFNLAFIWLSARFNWLKWYGSVGSVLFALLPLIGVAFRQPKFDLDHFWWQVAGSIAMGLGVAVIIWAKMVFKATSLLLGDASNKLITAGPYQFIRHPMYLGLVFIYVGWWWVWATVYSFYFGMIILFMLWLQAWLEEKLALEKTFGSDYLQYKKHTGMFWIK